VSKTRSSSEPGLVEHEVTVPARPETVFAYFTDPEKIVRWMGTEATLDPRPGGVCRITVVGVAPVLGEFVEIDPPYRIVFTWNWEERWFGMPPQSTTVEVFFEPDGDGTIVRVAHRQLPPAAADLLRSGWEHYLGRLVIAAAGDLAH
jgi:uncharacterized protein YndB with AHSA1/START domain